MYFHIKHILTIKIELLLKIHFIYRYSIIKSMKLSTNSRLILAQLGRQLFADRFNWEDIDLVVKPIISIEEMSKEIECLAKEVSEEVGIEDWRIWLYD